MDRWKQTAPLHGGACSTPPDNLPRTAWIAASQPVGRRLAEHRWGKLEAASTGINRPARRLANSSNRFCEVPVRSQQRFQRELSRPSAKRFHSGPNLLALSPPMAGFPPKIVDRLMADCRRHCCVCLRWAGQRMHIHHIVPEAENGSGEYGNGIPVCLDCHAEIESKSNMGRRFTEGELRQHRDRWFATLRDHPEVMVAAARAQSETGPLEAMLAELQFNSTTVFEGPPENDFPLLEMDQFRRAIATNAFGALELGLVEALHRLYALVSLANYHLEEMARVDRSGGVGSAWFTVKEKRTNVRGLIKDLVPSTISRLEQALGRTASPSETDLRP